MLIQQGQRAFEGGDFDTLLKVNKAIGIRLDDFGNEDLPLELRHASGHLQRWVESFDWDQYLSPVETRGASEAHLSDQGCGPESERGEKAIHEGVVQAGGPDSPAPLPNAEEEEQLDGDDVLLPQGILARVWTTFSGFWH